MKETLRVIHEMRLAGVISEYAIGGAVGAIYYLEPINTNDLDVFVTFETAPGSLIASPAPIYEYLAMRGYRAEREYVRIEGWLVQFLPCERPLYAEALAHAVAGEVEEVPTRIFSAEHLMAIALETGRAKDQVRLLQFLEEGAHNPAKFQAIVRRHGLVDKWERFNLRYPQL